MKKLLDAVLLKGLWKIKPFHVVLFWLFLAYQGWMGSPYFMYYVVGAPEPGTAPRYVGKLRVSGELQRTRDGWIPPRYFVQTAQGEVEFHCGYLPYKRECFGLGDDKRIEPDGQIVVGSDPYWGVDYMKLPFKPVYAHKNEYYESLEVKNYGRTLSLSTHLWSAIRFCAGLTLYLLLVLIWWGLSGPPRPRRPGDPPTEAEVAEQLRAEAAAHAAKPAPQHPRSADADAPTSAHFQGFSQSSSTSQATHHHHGQSLRDSHHLLKAVKLASATLLLIANAIPNVVAADRWKEEVLLHDGRKIIVDRSQTYGGRSEIGQAPPIKELRFSFELPGHSKTIAWTSEYGEELGRTNFKLLALHVLGDVPYLVTVPNLCLSYNKWGRPNPPYVVFRHDGINWNRIELKDLPADFRTINLMIDTLGEKSTIAKHPIVSAALVETLNRRLKQPEYRSILREPLPEGGVGVSDCAELVYYKCGWGSPSELNRKYFERTCK